MNAISLLRLTNTILEAAIVILISSVLLYGIGANIRSRVARASNMLLGFTVIAYFGDLLLTQVTSAAEMERWLRAEWIGIAFVPSAYLHLSNALLELGRRKSPQRRFIVWSAYAFSAVALALATFTELIVRGNVINLAAPQLQAGVYFPLFMLVSGGLIVLGAVWQIQARRQSRTATMRHRISYLIASAGGPAISVFPYLVITGQSTLFPSPLFWLVQIVGNAVVGMTIFFMTYGVAYFGVHEPDRVVRLRLIKFLARGPMVAIGVLVLLVTVDRVGRFLGLSADKATPFVVVAGIVLFQWFILLIKPTLERWFYFGERNEVVQIQELRDRIVTPTDLRQFLEDILASVCELWQVETAFIASLAADGTPQVELIMGQLALSNGETNDGLEALKLDLTPSNLPDQGEWFSWNSYWIISLYDRGNENVLGILGVQKPVDSAQSTAEIENQNKTQLAQLANKAATALEDRLLQQEVFSAMEGLLQRVTDSQLERQDAVPETVDLASTEEFTALVRDALNHYWGGPKLTQSPLLRLKIVQQVTRQHQGSTINAMRSVLMEAIESLRPEGQRSLTTGEWILYNILELKFLKRYKVRDVARRLAMSESDLYRKQRIAIEAVAQAIAEMETQVKLGTAEPDHTNKESNDQKKEQHQQEANYQQA